MGNNGAVDFLKKKLAIKQTLIAFWREQALGIVSCTRQELQIQPSQRTQQSDYIASFVDHLVIS